jgi:hypothetical protein
MLHKLNEPADDKFGEFSGPNVGHAIVVEHDPEIQEEMEQLWRFQCDQCGRVAVVPSEKTMAKGMKPPKEGEFWPEFEPLTNKDGAGWWTGVGGSPLLAVACRDVDVIGVFRDRKLDFCSFGCLADWAANAERYIDDDQVPPAP